MERIEGAGVELAVERATGGEPAVVAVHGTAQTRSVWGRVAAAMPGRAFVAYDRRGYGDSGEPEGYAGTTIEEQAEDLAALITATCAQPPVLLGQSFGAVVCLDLLLRHPEAARAAVLIEPPLLVLHPRGAEVISRLRERLAVAARERPGGALVAFADDVGGATAVELLGPSPEEEAAGSLRGFAPDLVAVPLWSIERRRLRSLSHRVLVLTGAESPAYFGEIAEAVVSLLAKGELRRMAGGHMLHAERPADVAAAVSELAGEGT